MRVHWGINIHAVTRGGQDGAAGEKVFKELAKKKTQDDIQFVEWQLEVHRSLKPSNSLNVSPLILFIQSICLTNSSFVTCPVLMITVLN